MGENAEDRWYGAGDGPEIELVVKASRFLGRVLMARDEDEALRGLQAVRKRHHDARHHCWAYRLPPVAGARERYDDDGEPARTAGAPILQAVQGSGLKGLIVVVTRWFGGTKLGSGGLVRAYGDAARAALAAAPRIENWIESRLAIDVAWEDVGLVETFLAREAARLRGVERRFEERARFALRVPRSQAGSLASELVEATAGRAGLQVEEIA